MAGSSGFFDATELADGTYDKTYVAEQFAKYFSLFVGNGVFVNPANQLKVVSANNGMYVTISPGYAFINGYWFSLDTGYTFPITINDSSTSDRIDGIFLRLDLSEGEIDVVYEAGRNVPNRTAPYYELKLAEVSVPTASTTVTDARITDTRALNSVCGFVSNLLQITSTEDLFLQWTTAYNEWKTALEEWEATQKQDFEDWESEQEQSFENWEATQMRGFSSWRSEQQGDFVTWFNAIKGQLTEDAAGSLQIQLNELRDNIAEEYNSSRRYYEGEFCIYDNKLYKCKEDMNSSEEWDISSWNELTVGDELYELAENVISASSPLVSIEKVTPNEGAAESYELTFADGSHVMVDSYAGLLNGTCSDTLVADPVSVAVLSVSQVRNIKASTTDLTAGSSTLATGDIYIVYE